MHAWGEHGLEDLGADRQTAFLRVRLQFGRAKDSFSHPEEEDGYLLGATLLYLLDRFHEKRRPFAIYTIGHTHRPVLCRFDVRAEYTSTAHEEATRGENRS